MKKIILYLTIGLILASIIFAATLPEMEWSKTFGGAGEDEAQSVQQTKDGGYVIAGYTQSFETGNYDAWVIKTDENGKRVWSKRFGGADYDNFMSVQQTKDEGYIMAGYTQSFGAGAADAWLIKLDKKGSKVWIRIFGGVNNDVPYSVQQTKDEGYIMAGYTRSFGAGDYDAWIIKTDSNGRKVWDKTFGGSDDDEALSIQQTIDGGYIITGVTKSSGAGDYDVWLIKTDQNGNNVWDRTFGGFATDEASSVRNLAGRIRVQQTVDEGYVIVGSTKSFGAGNYDVWLIRTDQNGNKVWDRTFGGTDKDIGHSVQQTKDGGYIIAGLTQSFGAGGYDAWVVKINPKGNKEWDKTFGGVGHDSATPIQQTKDGGYVIAGYTQSSGAGNSDFWLIKLSGSGDLSLKTG